MGDFSAAQRLRGIEQTELRHQTGREGKGSRGVGPLELELDLLLIPLPLVFDVELGTGGHIDPLPGDLDLEPLARFQRIRQPSNLRHKPRGGVDLLDVPVALFAHRSSPLSPNTRPFDSLQGPRSTAKLPRGYIRPLAVAHSGYANA